MAIALSWFVGTAALLSVASMLVLFQWVLLHWAIGRRRNDEWP